MLKMFQSRNRVSSLFKTLTVHVPAEELPGFNLVIEYLLFSSLKC